MQRNITTVVSWLKDGLFSEDPLLSWINVATHTLPIVSLHRVKRDLYVSKETCTYPKRPIYVKRDQYLSKETHIRRHLWISKETAMYRRDLCISKKTHISKETYTYQKRPKLIKRDLYIKRDHYISKETYTYQKRPIHIRRGVKKRPFTPMIRFRAKTHSHVWRDSSICVSWLIHIRAMIHFSHPHLANALWHDACICVPWLILMCDMTPSHVCHDSFSCVPQLFHVCAMTHSHMCHNSPIHMCAMTHSDAYMCYHSFVFVTWLLHVREISLWHDFFMSVTWSNTPTLADAATTTPRRRHITHTHTHTHTHTYTYTPAAAATATRTTGHHAHQPYVPAQHPTTLLHQSLGVSFAGFFWCVCILTATHTVTHCNTHCTTLEHTLQHTETLFWCVCILTAHPTILLHKSQWFSFASLF